MYIIHNQANIFIYCDNMNEVRGELIHTKRACQREGLVFHALQPASKLRARDLVGQPPVLMAYYGDMPLFVESVF